jgi:hypothetical protein
METIKFWVITEKIKGLEYDGDTSDLRLHSDERINWGAGTKREYQRIEKKLNKFEIKGEGWVVYVGHDVSGYEYWMKTMEEDNYVMVSVGFDTEDVLVSELDKIENAVYDAIATFSELSTVFY